MHNSGVMNRKDLQTLTRLRLSDARVLLANKKYDPAYYLALGC